MLDSRLRQPGWGGAAAGGKRGGKRTSAAERQSGDTSLPPILDRGSLLPQPAQQQQQPRQARAASVGRGGGEERERHSGRDHSLPPLRRGTGAGEASPAERQSRGERDHSLPPLQRSASAAPVASQRPSSRDRGQRGARPPRQQQLQQQEAGGAEAPPPRGNHRPSRGVRTPEADVDVEASPQTYAQRKPPAAPRGYGRGCATPGSPTEEQEAPHGQRRRSSSRKPAEHRASPKHQEDGDRQTMRRTSSRGVLQREVPAAPEARHFAREQPAARESVPREQPAQREPAPRHRAAAREAPSREPAPPPPPPPVAEERPASPTLKGLGAVAPSQLAAKAAELAVEDPEANGADDGDLVPCQHCGRKFKEDVLAKHENICVKVFQKKRKVYNPTEHRLPDDPALAEVKRKAAQQTRKGEVGIGAAPGGELVKKNAWRAKSEAFRAAMKDAQMVKKFQKEGRPLSELPPPAATKPELDDRTPCPHCGRRFGEQQAARHIPLCAAKKGKPAAKAQPPRNTSKKRLA